MTVNSSEFDTMSVLREGGIVQITLNRPDRLNAMNNRMFEEISGLVAAVAADETVRVVIYTGAGRAFCAGREISELLERAGKPEPMRVPIDTGREYDFVQGIQVPIIAAVNGAAAGSGFGLAPLADFRIASETAKFVEAHVKRGLTPSVAAWYLPKLVGLSRATEMILLDDPVSATDALGYGMVNRVVPPEQLHDAAWELARRLEALPPLTVRLAKHTLELSLSEPLADVRRRAGWGQVLTRVMTSEQSQPPQVSPEKTKTP